MTGQILRLMAAALAATALTPNAEAAVTCTADEDKVTYAQGIDMLVDDIAGGPEYLGLPGGGPAIPAGTDTFYIVETTPGKFNLEVVSYDFATQSINHKASTTHQQPKAGMSSEANAE